MLFPFQISFHDVQTAPVAAQAVRFTLRIWRRPCSGGGQRLHVPAAAAALRQGLHHHPRPAAAGQRHQTHHLPRPLRGHLGRPLRLRAGGKSPCESAGRSRVVVSLPGSRRGGLGGAESGGSRSWAGGWRRPLILGRRMAASADSGPADGGVHN